MKLEPTRPAHLQFELAFPATTLAAFTREENGVTRNYIGGTASSTMEDLKGSVISAQAQVIMLDKLRGLARKMSDSKSGMTAWLSHNYTIPEDTLGAFTGASLATRNEGGTQFIDLDIECRCVDFSSNPRAEAAFKQVQDGIRHGWSIGAYFKDIKWLSDDEDSPDYYKYEVTDIDLLEISLVGIPANQRAWVRDMDSAKDYAVKRAERIASESCSREHKRELVQRSIIEQRGIDGAQNLALAEDLRERSKQAHLDQRNVDAFNKAAEALESRDDGGMMSPDDMRDRISMGISHIARGIGHGVCVKTAGHLAKSVECLASIVGGNGGAGEPASTVNGGEPEGDENPNEIMTATARAQEALVELEALCSSMRTQNQEIDDMLVAKREALAAAEASMAQQSEEAIVAEVIERNSELSALESDIKILKQERDLLTAKAVEHETVVTERRAAVESELEAARGELEAARAERAATIAERDTVIAEIADRKAERLGRLSKLGNEMTSLAKQSETYMKPEDYNASHAEVQAALVRQAAGKAAPPPMTGRDAALAQERQT